MNYLSPKEALAGALSCLILAATVIAAHWVLG
jgi:hypothetical protein